MQRSNRGEAGAVSAWLERVGALASGVVLALAFLKWGNPVILDSLVARPGTGGEWLWMTWPVAFGYATLAVAVAVAAPGMRWRGGAAGWPLVVVPWAWLGWVAITAGWSVAGRLTAPVLTHFVACCVCFCLGCFVVGPSRRVGWFWVPVILGFGFVLFLGFGQHYGGLEQTREMLRSRAGWETWPPEFLRRVESDRVFSTLFYANTLASLVILVLPGAAWNLWQILSGWPRVARASVTGALIYAGLACLYWSGSKGGWLVASAVAVFILWQRTSGRGARVMLVGLVMVLALAGLAIRFKGYFDRGATSVVARAECWGAAIRIVRERPWVGSGPGTFAVEYAALKRPEAEMARLVHNDYLQQASDSGVPGFLLYTGMIMAFLVVLYRKSMSWHGGLLVYAGYLGWALHSVIEFGLYIPAVGWTAFLFAGYLLGAKDGVETNRWTEPWGRTSLRQFQKRS